jgi:hypothetical protein
MSISFRRLSLHKKEKRPYGASFSYQTIETLKLKPGVAVPLFSLQTYHCLFTHNTVKTPIFQKKTSPFERGGLPLRIIN